MVQWRSSIPFAYAVFGRGQSDSSKFQSVPIPLESSLSAFRQTAYVKGNGNQLCTASLRAKDSLIRNGNLQTRWWGTMECLNFKRGKRRCLPIPKLMYLFHEFNPKKLGGGGGRAESAPIDVSRDKSAMRVDLAVPFHDFLEEKNREYIKFQKTIKYIRIKVEYTICYDLQLLNMVKQIHTKKIRPKMLLISILWAKSNSINKFA